MSEMTHIGKLGTAVISAPTPFIVRFADGQILHFGAIEDAFGFLAFYNQSRTARVENPAKLYVLNDGKWEEKPLNPARVTRRTRRESEETPRHALLPKSAALITDY